jgi:hypothetical protein
MKKKGWDLPYREKQPMVDGISKGPSSKIQVRIEKTEER